jgi:hypothetical protein
MGLCELPESYGEEIVMDVGSMGNMSEMMKNIKKGQRPPKP